MSALVGVLICLSPLLFCFIGYYIGRYGSPIIIKRQPRRDRRAMETPTGEDEPETVVYRADQEVKHV